MGCGLHPITFPYTNIYYIAADIGQKNLRKVKKHFKKNKIKGEILNIDLNKEIPKSKADITFLFKILDQLPRKRVKEILVSTTSKHIIASFPTRTITGKRMNKPRRIWFENILKKLRYSYEIVRYFNEIFYVIKK